jgi:hypothetical protein
LSCGEILVAHLSVVSVALAATFVFGIYLPWIEAALITIAGGFVRELRKHDWDWTKAGKLDLTFIASGAAFAAFFI